MVDVGGVQHPRHWPHGRRVGTPSDLVRYAETLGHEFDYPNHNAWRYRDYVIRAFNSDVPYDRFVTEHIAGDLLPEPRRLPTDGFNESIIATGFFWLGQRDHSPVDVRQHQAELIDNQIDVMSKRFSGSQLLARVVMITSLMLSQHAIFIRSTEFSKARGTRNGRSIRRRMSLRQSNA